MFREKNSNVDPLVSACEAAPVLAEDRKIFAAFGLAVIILLGAFLRFYQLGAANIGNEYYAAAVKSMLISWHNFFFVAFEPGGSVTLDKPPLGFWLETVSAYFFGVNGFALAFPNALAGTLSIPLLYALVKKQFGLLAGLASALALASMPISIAAERNNTVDGMLVFVLLLAAWSVWESVESGQFRYLLLGALLLGLGFNIKMLQAYMVLPALYALYFFGAKRRWGRQRIVHLGLATGLLLAVSLCWALIVDSVPAESRPFIGSSVDNSVIELIAGHNGIRRLLGGGGPGGGPGGGQMPASSQAGDAGQAGRPGFGLGLPAGDGQPPQAPDGFNQINRPGGPNEVGTAGPLRLFVEPLASQVSWLLPLALLGLALSLVLLGARPWSPDPKHLALILWAGWLLPMALYFTFTSGLWHAYYLCMLGPGLAALVGATVWAFEQLLARQDRLGWGLVAVLSGITLGFEVFILSGYPAYFAISSGLMLILWVLGVALLWARPQTWALAIVFFSLLPGPVLWSGLTTFTATEANLPKAGPGFAQPWRNSSGASLSPTQQTILAYLQANSAPDAYLVATFDAPGAAPFILATGRATLALGGFSGQDNVLTVSQLQKMVASGKLRYVLDQGNLSQKAEIFSWVKSSCAVALSLSGMDSGQPSSPGIGDLRDQQPATLYDCP